MAVEQGPAELTSGSDHLMLITKRRDHGSLRCKVREERTFGWETTVLDAKCTQKNCSKSSDVVKKCRHSQSWNSDPDDDDDV